MPKERILVIDDDTYIRKACADFLTAVGYDVCSADDGEAGVAVNSEKGPFDLVITDLKMPGIDGIEVLKIIKEQSVKTDVIVITAHGTIENAVEAMRFGAYDYLIKNFDTEELDLTVKRCFEKRRLTTEVRELKELVNLYEASKAISSLMSLDELLNLILRLVCDTLSADGGSLMIYDQETDELSVKAAIGHRKDEIVGKKIALGERIAGYAAKEITPVSLQGTLKNDPRFSHLEAFSGITSAITMPLERKGKLLGVINLNRSKISSQFNNRDQSLLSIFAVEAAIAMENNNLFNKLEQEKEELNATFSGMGDGAIVTNNALKINRMNNAAELLLGVSQKDSAGKIMPELLADFESSIPWETIRCSEGTTRFELKRTKGSIMYLGVLATALSDQEKKHIGQIMVLRDITSEKKEEKIKGDFLALISHKLKTPLTAIRGFSELLVSRAVTGDDMLRTGLLSIEKQSEVLDVLVDKLLRFTLLTSEYTSVHQKKTDAREMVGRSLKGLDGLMQSSGAQVTIDSSVGALPPVNADSMKTEEALENIIMNAIKFNDKKIKTVEIKGRIAEGNFAAIDIIDNGPGIPPEEHKKIFQKFHQIDKYFTGQIEGVGLGLAVAKYIVELQGGRIELKSILGVGSTFTVLLPLATA